MPCRWDTQSMTGAWRKACIQTFALTDVCDAFRLLIVSAGRLTRDIQNQVVNL